MYRAVNEFPDTFEDLRSKWNLKIARVEMITVNTTSNATMGPEKPTLKA